MNKHHPSTGKMRSLIACLLLLSGSSSSPCAKRFFPELGPNHFVCVCNSTYCDEYEKHKHSSGTAIIYTSSEISDRMTKSTAAISKPKGPLVSLITDLLSPSVHQSSSNHSSIAGKIKLNPEHTYQDIIGFGGAFTDATGINVASLSKPTQDRLMQTMFGKKGARYTIGRVPMASNDFSTHVYSYNDHAGDISMSKFALNEADLKLKIPLIHHALNLTEGELRLFSSPWSAPAWMKNPENMVGPGHLIDGMEAAWAKYFVRFFEEYLTHGISFWATTVQNEPSTGAVEGFKWQTMYWNVTGEQNFVGHHLGLAMAASAASKHVKIIALDDFRIWFPSWPKEFFSDPIASSFVSGMAVHWYFEDVVSPSVLSETHYAHPDKFILATEACAGSVPPFTGPELGSWTRAEEYARSIISDINNFVTGWTDWNMALDLQGGPNWAENFVDSPIIVNATSDEFYKQPMHYALTHFSRFVRPGAKRILSTTEGIDDDAIMHTAFVQDGQRILVVLNRNATAQDIDIEEADGTTMNLKIAPRSISTVIWKQ